MLAGVSTHRYRRVEPVGAAVEAGSRSTSRSAVSRQFVARTRENLQALMGRRLDDVRLAVLMLDGIDLKGRTNVVALGITTDGAKNRRSFSRRSLSRSSRRGSRSRRKRTHKSIHPQVFFFTRSPKSVTPADASTSRESGLIKSASDTSASRIPLTSTSSKSASC